MRRKPWGVVAVITPWNFPFAVPLWMLGPSCSKATRPSSSRREDTPGDRPAAGRAVRRGRLPAGRRSTSSTATARSARRWCATRTSTSCCSPAATRSASASRRCRPSIPRPHRRRRDGQQERRHRLRGRPARPGGDRGHHQRASRRAASAASRRAASSSHEIADRPLRRGVRRRRRSGCGSATRSTPSNFTGPVINAGAVEKVAELQRPGEAGGRRGPARRRPDAPTASTARAAYLSPFVYRMRARARACARSARRCSARTWR